MQPNNGLPGWDDFHRGSKSSIGSPLGMDSSQAAPVGATIQDNVSASLKYSVVNESYICE
ncbi:MAG: hypothetical protein HQ521_11435 [Bacteroidetes bacterium]|nr:hypothetical protein [Bacteroidota bacterium]